MSRTAVIAGVGPGLGASLAHRFVEEGCQVGLFARSKEYLDELADELGDDAVAVPTDITDPEQVQSGF
jgi:NADP-dependent 3-hydroxy acid dehydrogenase YdfG